MCKTRNVLLMLVIIFLTIFGGKECFAEKMLQKTVSVAIKEEITLKQALSEVSRQTGYKVIVSDELSSIPIKGIFRNLTIDDFLKRVLKKYNVSVVYDDDAQIATIRSFGEDLGRSDDGKRAFYAVSEDVFDNNETESSEAIDPLSGMPMEELKRLQTEQIAELKKYREDPDSIDPLGNIPLSMGQENQAKLDQHRQDPDAVDPLSNIPYSELREKQNEFDRKKKESTAVDPLSQIPTSYFEQQE